MLMSSMQNIHWRIEIHINKTRRDNLLYYYHLLKNDPIPFLIMRLVKNIEFHSRSFLIF